MLPTRQEDIKSNGPDAPLDNANEGYKKPANVYSRDNDRKTPLDDGNVDYQKSINLFVQDRDTETPFADSDRDYLLVYRVKMK